MIKDFPKNTEWLLSKNIDKGETYYEFIIWIDIGNPIAYFRSSTASLISKRIEKLAKKLNKKRK